jgi:hypothetical protein
MITRYVLHLTCSKDDPEGNPRRLQMVFLSAGGNNVLNDAGRNTHQLVSVLEGDKCPTTPAPDVHVFIVTPTSYNEWLKQAETRFPRAQWNKKVN